ncbi:TPA: ion transporter [Salmonella enterica]|nr:ion transporter [Salmonella enterica]HAK6562382.1 ion transporter [Salmonella enterica]
MLTIMKQHKFALLLTALLSTFFINLFPLSASGYNLSVLLQAAAGVNLLQRRHQAVSFIVLLVIFTATHWLHTASAMALLYYGSYLVFFLILAVIVFRQVIFSARINTESVCAALSGFLLIGYMGFFIFSAIESHMPGSFRGLSSDELQMMNELFYYSFISILTVGYGDIVAVSWPARNATILVILTGYIYSLVFIARIVSGFSVSDK